MGEQLVVLTAGFLLTTVLGGVLGYIFQNRAWTHQHEVERRDERRRQALQVFEEISTLMDRRIYRMRQVGWTSRDAVDRGESTADLRSALDDYRAVLRDWNDNLNRVLALVQASFGEGVRRSLEEDLFERFASIGRALDLHLRRVGAGRASRQDAAALGRRLTQLAHDVYALDVVMLQHIQGDTLGGPSPSATRPTAAPEGAMLELGDQGPAVRHLQEALRRTGRREVAVDGDFGWATQDAVRAVQAARGLDADGIVGPATWEALPPPAAPPIPGDAEQPKQSA